MEKGESRIEKERRFWTERQQRFKDLEEEFQRNLAAAADPEEQRALKHEFGAKRRLQREEDVRLGKRAPGLSVQMQQIMWARWIEVAVGHELEARQAFKELTSRAHSDPLLKEFRASLVAVTAAAHTIEALFGDMKYLIPVQPRRNKRHKQLRHSFRVAFGIPGAEDQRLASELAWLFTRRDSASHPYTESAPTEQHPAGLNTGVENSHFNAITSGRAVDLAMDLLAVSAVPPKPHNRWIERWAENRAPYHDGVIEELRASRQAHAF
jgi:hypothetical protein